MEFTTATRHASWATTTVPTCPSTITWRKSSRSATAGSARCPALPCPIACMPCVVWPLEAGMTGHPMCRPCTTSRPSSATSTLTTSPGAGIPSTPGRCAWRTPATSWATTTSSATSARPACRGRPFSTSASARRSQASSKTPPAARCRRCPGSTRPSPTSIRSASPSTMTTHRPTSRMAKTSSSPSTTRWRRARSGTVRCWSSSTTKTAASSITSRRLRPRTTSQKRSAGTACGCQRSSSHHGWNRGPYRAPCSITPRSSKRFCSGSAPRPCTTRSRPKEGAEGWA